MLDSFRELGFERRNGRTKKIVYVIPRGHWESIIEGLMVQSKRKSNLTSWKSLGTKPRSLTVLSCGNKVFPNELIQGSQNIAIYFVSASPCLPGLESTFLTKRAEDLLDISANYMDSRCGSMAHTRLTNLRAAIVEITGSLYS
jgi:hypothetical protein